MKKRTTFQIRQDFLDYFKQHGHAIVASSSLVPADDPTLLFTNAGMVQFKNIFLGKEHSKNNRVATAQRCIRAGGKHNDLENVGYTNRHHTFFEMLGNFSFGDYFKREAIHYAWDFLTQKLGIDPKKLWVTVHKKDTESAQLWQEEFQQTNTAAQGLSCCGDKDNFWAMGETGPCGYCSEIFYDHGNKFPGDPPGGKVEDERYVEIWNLVFMQFERDANGNLTSLPKPSIDTGMGLERIAAVMQGTHDNYEIDIFAEIRSEFYNFLDNKFGINATILQSNEAKIASRVIVDHIRSAVFLIAEGIMPSNEQAGYVLRSIIRRASYYLYHLGVYQPCFFQFIYPLLLTFGDAYPELQLEKQQQQIASIIEQEEIKFLDTLDRGLKILQDTLRKLKNNTIPGSIIFTLHDTYGFPAILTAEIARHRGLTLDQTGFEVAMGKQRENSRAAHKFITTDKVKLTIDGTTEFIGYTQNSGICKICALCKKDGTLIKLLNTNEEGIIVLDQTPFYAESGGQVGDTGEIYSDLGTFLVQDTQKYGALHLHYGIIKKGILSLKDSVIAEIDTDRRQAIELNHSSVHLLHTGLHFVLGKHAIQRGSSVDDQKLRLDFAHSAALTPKELHELEQLVNVQIRANLEVQTTVKSIVEAQRENAIALFGEKYSDKVRVVKMGGFSTELCGGTHVNFTGEIGLFKIIAETSVAAGIRRIEAITGKNALKWVYGIEAELKNIGQLLGAGTNASQITNRLQQILEEKRAQEKELIDLRNNILIEKRKDLSQQAVLVDNIQVLSAELLPNVDDKVLRQTVDALKQQLHSAVVVLASKSNNKVRLVVGVTKNLLNKIKANELLQHITKQINGSGGGRPDMAQGGGIKVTMLQKALDSVIPWIKGRI